MQYQFACACGAIIRVTAGQSGTRITCSCGRRQLVPPLTELRGTGSRDDTTANNGGTTENVTLLLTPPAAFEVRIDNEAFVHFVHAVQQAIHDYLDAHAAELHGVLQLGCALVPGGKVLVDLQVRPAALESGIGRALQQEVETLAPPPLEHGPIIFASRVVIGSGLPPAERMTFEPPFATLTRDADNQSLDQLIMSAAGIEITADTALTADTADEATPAPSEAAPDRRWWQRAGHWLRQRLRLHSRRSPVQRRAPVNRIEPPETVDLVEAPAHVLSAVDEHSIEQYTALIQRYPQDARLYRHRAELYRSEQQWDDALADYDQLLQLRGEDPETLAARGEVYCLSQQMQKGLADFTRALELDDHHLRARLDRAILFHELAAWEAAEADCDIAIALAPRRATLYYFRARARLARNNVAGTLEDLNHCLTADPHHADASFLRAYVRQMTLEGHSADVTPHPLDLIESDLNQVLRLQRDNSLAYAHRAEVRMKKLRMEEAIADASAALKLSPDSAWALGVRAVAYRCLGQLDRALADAEEAIRLDLQSAEVFYTRAVAYQENGDFELALDDCQQAIELAEDYAAAYELRGSIQLELGDHEEALASFNRAIELAPESGRYYVQRGNVFRIKDDMDRALQDYDEALRRDPEAVFAYMNRALTWEDKGEAQHALDDLNEVIRRVPDFVPAYEFRARIWSRRAAWDKALADFDTAIELDADFAPAYFGRGHLHLQQGRYPEAMHDFDVLLRLCPNLPVAYSSRASVRIHQGDHERALEDFREAIQLDPSSAEQITLQRLLIEASYYQQQEQFADAIRLASEALQMDETCTAALQIRAAAYWFSEQMVESLDDYARLLELGENSATVYNGHGQVLAELGEYEAALESLDQAIRLAEPLEDPAAGAYPLNGRGLALAGLRRYDEAADAFAKSLAACPDNGWTHYNRGIMLKQQGHLTQAAEAFQRAVDAQQPRLSPRKRSRAKAFLASQA